MIEKIIDKYKIEFEKVLDFFSKELIGIRTGIANPSLVQDIEVEVYGQKMKLKQLGGISCPGPKEILIQVWDKTTLKPIETAILKSQLGLTPIIERDLIRINLPPLTQEYREKFLKIISEKKEKAREQIRKIRDRAWNEIQELSKEGKLREDDKFKGRDELQKKVDEFNSKVEELFGKKKKEIFE